METFFDLSPKKRKRTVRSCELLPTSIILLADAFFYFLITPGPALVHAFKRN